MDFPEPLRGPEEPEAIIVKADEVDEAGADISTISPTDTTPSEFEARIETRRAQDAQAGGSPKILANAAVSPPKSLARPALRRETSAPPPPQQPPPPAPSQPGDASNATDSLSLQQLRQLVTDLPKFEPAAYAYTYQDTRSFPEELEEWFQYTEEERYMLLRAKQTFEEKWEQAQATRIDPSNEALEWTDVDDAAREKFVEGALKALEDPDPVTRVASLECLSYIALGAWCHTAGLEVESSEVDTEDLGLGSSDTQYSRCRLQLKWIRKGVDLLTRFGALQKLLGLLCHLSKIEHDMDMLSLDASATDDEIAMTRFNHQLELNQALTTLYVIIEIGRWEATQHSNLNVRRHLSALEPNFLLFLTQTIAKLRWDESSQMPIPRLLLMLWKAILLLFGGTDEFKSTKLALPEPSGGISKQNKDGFITTSPLDYHLFRQEITSKYPAYCPPQPLVPIEPENNSILPPLPTHPSRRASQENLQTRAGTHVEGTPGSIFHQPVHIATPAPSPPPSPAGPGGKGGKKQNYQTNQNFPFLYPPLDDTSNTVGGKGTAELQDKLVGKRWEGSDVPASIQEAGQLFASRMRMSRSIRQLWDVREEFIKYERGWNASSKDDHMPEIETSDDDDEHGATNNGEKKAQKVVKETEDEAAQRSLDSVESYYRDALPHLQSLVVVLWKVAFANVSNMVSQNGPNGLPNGISFGEDGGEASNKRKQNSSSAMSMNDVEHGQLAENGDGTDPEVEELNAIRTREVTFKAISGILIMLLKWFKLSHVLKFEYLAQLMLDVNYLPLILKLFAHQDVDRSVEQKNDREDLNFFTFCRLHSHNRPPTPPQPELSSSSSDDEAAPPPIKKHRRSPSSHSPPPSPPPPPLRPEVDELGYPTTSLPSSPLTTFSPRFFYTTITLLRILQKITKRKAHRALLLVQYKSSTILRRALKVPQPELRLYTLKLFKSQVPYCGRKWRQTNMRVITAIYLHCRPELRDEWLCGGDVDGVVEEAVPLEQAGRALVHWWHLRNYRGVMEGVESKQIKGDEEGNEDEMGFFERELEKMGWGTLGAGTGDGAEEQEGEGEGERGRSEFEGGPLQMEGWT